MTREELEQFGFKPETEAELSISRGFGKAKGGAVYVD